MTGTSVSGGLGNSSLERGDQSEHKRVIGKEGAVLLFTQGRRCGVGGGAVKGDCCLLCSSSQGDPV